MRAHVVAHHPEILVPFEEGWQKLGYQGQLEWLNIGRNPPSRPREPQQWRSWIDVRYDQLEADMEAAQLLDFDPEELHNTLSECVREKMPHAGALYDLPDMPPIAKSQPSHSSDAVSDDDEEDDEIMWTFRAIAEQAAMAILQAEIPKLIERLKEEIKEGGLDAVRKWYPPAPIDEGPSSSSIT